MGSASKWWVVVALLCLLGVNTRPGRASDPPKEALEQALRALEYDPERIDLLDAVSTCAERAGQGDVALFYATLGLAQARFEGREPVDLDRRLKRIGRLDPLKSTERPDLDEHGRRLLAIGTNCIDRRLYANAVEFLHRCKGTASGAESEAQLERLYGNQRSLQALLDTGIDVPVQDKTGRRALRLIRQDPEHEAWKDAWRIKGKNYTVITNVGWELANDVSLAMEQLHPFYRRVFLGKRGSGTTSRCTICIYRDLDEFLDHEPGADEETLGFYQPGENRIATYDPRSEGEGIGCLWETLFHEASHQFTDMVTTGIVPAWINEGTAAYFEGAHLQPSGRVAANRVPHFYLTDLKSALGDGDPSVREVVEYFEDGSYDASFYPVGWGLVYFLLNYEDDRCGRIYAPLYESYLKTYKKGGKHDSFERFQKYFIKKAKQPAVKDFAQFETRFKGWIDTLYELETGGGDKVDDLLARARRQAGARKWDAALESYRWALRKSPRHRACLLELAETLAKRKKKDAAIYFYRRLLDILEEASDPNAVVADCKGATVAALAEDVRGRLVELDPTMVQLQEGAEAVFAERVAAAATKYVEQGYPRVALLAMEGAVRLLGRAPELEKQRGKILRSTDVDVWRWRRLPPEAGLALWFPSGDWEVEEQSFAIDTRHRATLLARATMPERYRLEATVNVKSTGSRAFVGLLFGVGDSGILNVYGAKPNGKLEANRIVEQLIRRHKVGELRGELREGFRLAVEVDGCAARFFLDGSPVGEKYYDPGQIDAGRAGLFAEGARVSFSDVRIGR